MKFNGLLPALDPIISLFEKLGAGYYIGGSVASSSFGIPRTTLDIDIIVDSGGPAGSQTFEKV